MDDIYKDIEEYNPNKKRNILIVFDDMIDDMLSNKKHNPIVTELSGWSTIFEMKIQEQFKNISRTYQYFSRT